MPCRLSTLRWLRPVTVDGRSKSWVIYLPYMPPTYFNKVFDTEHFITYKFKSIMRLDLSRLVEILAPAWGSIVKDEGTRFPKLHLLRSEIRSNFSMYCMSVHLREHR